MADILHSLQISAPAGAIYPLVSTAQGLAEWWAADVTEASGAVELGFFNRQTVYRLRPLVHQPPSHCEWSCETGAEWSGTRLVFKLEPAGQGMLVRFTHAGWQSATDYFVSCTTVWGELMFRLKSAAEGKPRGPLFLPGSLAY
ncbi:MAG: SRPBCC domain-containing protein [Acidobacteriia bacterium]|nr:SRPBCC domain-containing protein [Terriglobia bacterium]